MALREDSEKSKRKPKGNRLISDFEFIDEILSKSAPITAKELARIAREQGIVWGKSEANSILYRMAKRNLVNRIDTGGGAPLWTKSSEITSTLYANQSQNVVESKKLKLKAKELPLQAQRDLTINIQGVIIEFGYNEQMGVNDPYMIGDWLNNKIFVGINTSHPFWCSFIDTDEKKSIYLTLIAEEVYVQWQVSRQTSPISSQNLLDIRDKAMRDIVSNSKSVE